MVRLHGSVRDASPEHVSVTKLDVRSSLGGFHITQWLLGSALGALVLFVFACVSAQAAAFTRIAGVLLVLSSLGFSVLAGSHLVSTLGRSIQPTVTSRRSYGQVAALIGLLACFLAYGLLYYHPSQRILGGSDEGLYVNTAVNLARAGHYYLDAPLLDDLSVDAGSALLSAEPAAAQRGTKLDRVHPRYHIGLFLDDAGKGRLTPQFPLGWPTFLGSVFSVAGWEGMQAANTWVLCLSAVLVGILVLDWLGAAAAISAFLLFLFFPLSAWVGRSFFAEPLLQCIWMIGLLGCRYEKSAPVVAGLITGLALGSLLFIKIEAVAAFAVLPCIAAWYWSTSRRFAIVALISGVLTAGLAVLALFQYNRFYIEDTFGTIRPKYLWIAAIVAVGAVAFFGSATARSFIRSEKTKLRSWQKFGFGVLLLLGFYAAILRPDTATFDSYFYWPMQREIRSFREETFLRIGWYLQPWGLAIASMGAAGLVLHLRRPWQVAFFAVGLLFLVALSYDIRNNPIQPYAMRRLLPFAMPLLIVGAAAAARALVRLLPLKSTKLRIGSLQALITIALLYGFYPVSEVLNRHSEFQGTYEQVKRLASKLPENALILVSEDSFLSWIATPMQFMFGREAMIIRPEGFGHPLFLPTVRQWIDSDRPVYMLTEMPGVRWYGDGEPQVMNPTHSGVFETHYLYQSPSERPQRLMPMSIRYYLVPLKEW